MIVILGEELNRNFHLIHPQSLVKFIAQNPFYVCKSVMFCESTSDAHQVMRQTNNLDTYDKTFPSLFRIHSKPISVAPTKQFRPVSTQVKRLRVWALPLLELERLKELLLCDLLQLLQDRVRTGRWVVCYWEVGHEMAVRRLALEGAAEGLEERQQLGNGGQGMLSEEGKLPVLRGRLLTQTVQWLGKRRQSQHKKCVARQQQFITTHEE